MSVLETQPALLSTRRGKAILALVCAAAFLDFIDTTIVNVALPSIRTGLGLSEENLQWVLSAYLLTYGGLLLLGGRAGDLLGRRRLFVAGTALFGLSSLVGGLADSQGVLIGARLAQGLGAAMMTPAALSILTTTFHEDRDRVKAIGVWAGTVPIASAAGVVLGGVLSEGPGWRWIFFVNSPISALVIAAAFRLLPGDRPQARHGRFDAVGAILSTAGATLLVYALVGAPTQGWSGTRTLGELVGALVLLSAFVVNERRHPNPLVPFSIFRIHGLAAADITQMLAQAGFISMFFFITLYMQNVLGFSPIQAGVAYLPVTAAVGIAAGLSTKLLPRVGTRPVIAGGTMLGAAGVFWLAQLTVAGSYPANLLPGLMVMALGIGCVFVGVQNAANAGVPSQQAGLAAALITTSTTLGAAVGLATVSGIAARRTQHLLASHAPTANALTGGFRDGLAVCGIFLLLATIASLRSTSNRGAPS